MSAEKLLYTDGHKVTVTDTTFRVDKNLYHLEGIIGHDFRVITPSRIPVLLLVSVGLALLLMGFFDLAPGNLKNLDLGNYVLTARLLSVIGATIFLAGVVLLITEKKKYGVQIVTAEGVKEVIVSKKKEYVVMIDEALTKALQRWGFSNKRVLTKKI